MTAEKGLDPAIIHKIGEYVKHKGGTDLRAKLELDALLRSNKNAKEGLTDMEILFILLNAYSVLDKISFDVSSAGGLDYYTDIIYEAIVKASAPPGFAAGGRYDGLVRTFLAGAVGVDPSPKKGKKATGPGDGLLEERIKLVQELREVGIKNKDEVSFAVILGTDEPRAGLVKMGVGCRKES